MAEQPAAARFARSPRRNPLLRAGLPLVGFVIFGTLALAQLVQGKKDVQDARASATDERLPVAVRRRKGRDDLEAEHKRLKEAMDINSYENKPVPRTRAADS